MTERAAEPPSASAASPVVASSIGGHDRAVWDGAALLGAVEAATERLVANREAVDALNVFPVPDGDTGTNMGLTMQAAGDEGRAGLAPGAGAGAVAAQVAFGALMGARGNSGVILSQVFRGVARAIEGRSTIDGRDLARALTGAREMAYKAVVRPVEGTMLTVVRVAAERAEAVAVRTTSLPTVLAEAVRGAREALAATPSLLDILRQAGVVDAGGQGIVHILEGMAAFARGEAATSGRVAVASEAARQGEAMAFLDRTAALHGGDAFGYCTNFVVVGRGLDVERCRAELAAMGDSAVIVGDDTLLRVHLHAPNPGLVLAYAVGLGELDRIKIDNMQIQTRTLAADRAPTPPTHLAPDGHRPDPQPLAPAASGTQAVVAVAVGAGLALVLRSMGAAEIVAGGQGMNPSIEELLAAVERAPGAEVLLLPNNPNVVLTADQVPGLADKRVAVVPSRTLPQGLAALAAYREDEGLEANARRMTAALGTVRTVEVTRAVRDAGIDGATVAAGQAIGLLDDRLVAGGDDEAAVAMRALTEAGLVTAELVTIFVGAGVGADATEALWAAIRDARPELAIEVHEGGQPHYRFVIAVE